MFAYIVLYDIVCPMSIRRSKVDFISVGFVGDCWFDDDVNEMESGIFEY